MRRLIWGLLFLVGLWWLPAAALAGELGLSGVVRDAEGRPVAGAEVSLYRGKNVKRPADFLSNRTTEDGRYTVAAPAGAYWAVAVLRTGEKRFGPLDLGDRHSGEAVAVEIREGGELSRDFTVMDLREAARQHQKKNADLVRLSGRILARNGQPLTMAAVVADPSATVRELPAQVSAWSDSSGGYVLFLPPGTYHLGAVTEFPPPPGLRLGREITLTADSEGVDLTAEVDAPPAGPGAAAKPGEERDRP